MIKSWKAGLGSGAAALIVATTLLSAAPAHAASKGFGPIECTSGWPSIQNIHSLSTAKGNVKHHIYNAWTFGAAWETATNEIIMGYSSTYTSWDGHHWNFVKAGSGKIWGSGVTMANRLCK